MTRRDTKNIIEVFGDIARRKSAAAQARFSGKRENVEASIDVFRNSCAAIASHFDDSGYTFAKSGPHMTKRSQPFNFRISFGTSYHNIPGEYVCLRLAAAVTCPRLKKWRRMQKNPFRTDDVLGGGMSHNVASYSATTTEWDLADARKRENTILDIVKYIETLIFEYFNKFNDIDSLLQELIWGNIKAVDLSSSIELALCLNEDKIAQKMLDIFVEDRTDLHNDIFKEMKKLDENGFPDYIASAYAEQVAWANKAYGLSIHV